MVDKAPPDPHDRSEVLFQALTRPALWHGAPFEGVICNGVGMFFVGMIFSSPTTIWRCPILFWAMAFPNHMIMRRLAGWDWHAFRAIRLRLTQRLVGINRLEVMSFQPPKTVKDIPSSV